MEATPDRMSDNDRILMSGAPLAVTSPIITLVMIKTRILVISISPRMAAVVITAMPVVGTNSIRVAVLVPVSPRVISNINFLSSLIAFALLIVYSACHLLFNLMTALLITPYSSICFVHAISTGIKGQIQKAELFWRARQRSRH